MREEVVHRIHQGSGKSATATKAQQQQKMKDGEAAEDVDQQIRAMRGVGNIATGLGIKDVRDRLEWTVQFNGLLLTPCIGQKCLAEVRRVTNELHIQGDHRVIVVKRERIRQ